MAGNKNTNYIINNSYTGTMKTLSINKNLSVFSMATKWWNSKNLFLSTIVEEDFTNREVVLVHLILIAVLVGAIAVEVSFIVSLFSLIIGGTLAACLNRSKENDNINSKKNIL